MKQKLRLLSTLLLLAVASMAWGDGTASFAPSNFSGQGTSGSGSAISATVDGVTFACDKGYGTTQIRCYSGGTITISSSNTITAISFTFSGSYTGGLATSYENLNTTSWEQTLSSQARITAVTVTYTGSATETVATPTFNPAAGAVFAGTEVSISCLTTGASIYYTTNGNTPSASEGTLYANPIVINEATIIKAIAVKDGAEASEIATAEYTIKPTISGFNIDFENDLDCYVDWAFNNIGNSNTTITAHGGSKYGANMNDSGNGVATASITTKNKVAYPGVFTCYISKTTSNSTSSNWKIQVSPDGETWTDVSTHSATNMSNGQWVEFTGDIKTAGYTNVYVRLNYEGSTAIRAVDDISLTTYKPAAVEAPIITVAEKFAISTTATITCVTDGATIYYSYDESNWTEYTAPLNITETETVYAKAVKGEGVSSIVSATTTKVTTMTVAEAIAATPGSGSTDEVYIHGIVSAFYKESIMGDGNNYRYYISDDGTTTTQLLVYKGKGLNNVAFIDDDDLRIGDEVVICGQLTTYNDAPEINSGNYLIYHHTKFEPGLTYETTEYTVAPGATFETPTLTNPNGLLVTYSISENDGVATINTETGAVTIGDKEGTVTVTASFAGNETYYSGSASYTIMVQTPPTEATYVLATSITSGKRYVITSGTEGNVMVMGDQTTNNRGAEEATIGNDGKLTVSEEYEFVIVSATIGEASGYSIFDEGENGYLYAASSSKNYLKTQGTNDVNGLWTIEFDSESGFASIVAESSSNHNVMQFNANNGNPIFSCYASASQAHVYLFEKAEDTPAEPEAYAVVEKNDAGKPTSVTFYYNGEKASHESEGTIVDIIDGTRNEWENWTGNAASISLISATFDESFGNFNGLKSLRNWFSYTGSLVIEGMGNLKTDNVESMSGMFMNSGVSSVDLSHFNTSNVTDMGYMFYNSNSLTSLDVSSFDTEKVTNMSNMFYSCSSLTRLDVSNFDTQNVTNMSAMFHSCSSLTSLDVSNFDTKKVTNMSEMFRNNGQIVTIYAGEGWNTDAVTSSNNIFLYCKKLVGGNGTVYDPSNVNKSYAHIDGLNGQPGYLTDINQNEPVSVNISAAGYSTLYYGTKNLTVPTGMEAYTVKVTTQVERSTTYNAGDVIPAGTGVVLKAAKGSYTFNVSATAGNKDNDNMLRGSDVKAKTTGGTYYYALTLNAAKDPDSAGFYWMVENGGAYQAGAHKAYLALDNTFAELAGNGTAKGYLALPGDETDGIGQIEIGQTSNAGIYNLNGQKVNKAQKGIYIVNGKKVVIR